jgi:hypothetical protein
MEISPKNDDQRLQLMDELYQRYGGDSGLTTLSNRVRFWRKKYAWSIVVSGAKMLKRIIDILAAGLMLIALSPLFLPFFSGNRGLENGDASFHSPSSDQWSSMRNSSKNLFWIRVTMRTALHSK